MRNIKLTIKFVGSQYHGWQIQKNAITVQQVLKEAISAVTKEDNINLNGCSRTDSGVHAQMFVANFFTETKMPDSKIHIALNAWLPDDIICLSSEEVPLEFDASRSAVKKRYTYRILNSSLPDPFMFPYTHYIRLPLDVEKMKKAAAAFTGTHDFVGFASSGYTVKTTVRTIFELDVSKKDDLITINVVGDGFLYNMVRIIAGTLIAVGNGLIDPENMADIIKSKDRNRAGATAPAKGLCLSEVFY